MTFVRSRGFALAAAAAGVVGLLPAPAKAHFVLQSPLASTEQNALGNPQKAPPCGDDGSATPTGDITTVQAGGTVTITIDETIYHPGHYRIALALNDPSELPDPPPVTPGSTPCGSAPIDPDPQFPVLADGVFEHTAAFAGPQSIDVTIPDDITCTNCTLQVIEFMSNHGLNDPGGCYYHHCATIAVVPAGSETSDGSSSADTGSSSGDASDTSTTSGNEATSVTAGEASGTAAGGEGSGTVADTASGTAAAPADGGSGCACAARPDRSGPGSLLLGFMGLMLGRVRRRRRASECGRGRGSGPPRTFRA